MTRDQAYWERWLGENADRLRADMATARDWYKAAGVEKGERRAFKAALRGLGEEGVRSRKGHNVTGPRTGHGGTPYGGNTPAGKPGGHAGRKPAHSGASRDGAIWEGRLRTTREGRFLVIPDLPDAPGVRVSGEDLLDALPKDRVAVRLESPRRGRPLGAAPQGRIVRVLERGIRTFVGRFTLIGKRGYVNYRDREADLNLPLDCPARLSPQVNDIVLAEINDYPEKGKEGRAALIRVLGREHTMETLFLAVAHARDLPVDFSRETIREASSLPPEVHYDPAASSGEAVTRVDLRHLPFVTIDGDDARDFDDAVCLVREGKRMRLYVAIADVAHYVRVGSPIDKDAYARGTSVYFPDRAVPMLPPALSEGLCSLKPGVDRLTMTAEMPIDADGKTGKPSFHASVIRSRERLTYARVHDFLAGTPEARERAAVPGEVAPMLREMAALAATLSKLRSARGSLDFDLPETRIIVEDGKPVSVGIDPRWESHRLIEEFMLLANTAVAEFLSDRGLPFLFRIHEPPTEKKLLTFEDAAARLLKRARVTQRKELPARLQAWVDAAKGGKYEQHVSMLMLRSLMLARYGPEQIGHFGLALERYTHFTSPIRRYPDLIVHRMLMSALGDPAQAEYVRHLEESGEEVGEHLSARERAATDAERDVEQRAKALYMSRHVGETFNGVIASVARYGFFVVLDQLFVEGFVHISTLRDDEYRYSADGGEWVGSYRRRRFSLADRVSVRVRRADADRGEIDLILVEKLPDSL
ncbi:MAG TPA: ribonuclease R [Candidatus Deferrimicrobiaceae bacterium]